MFEEPEIDDPALFPCDALRAVVSFVTDLLGYEPRITESITDDGPLVSTVWDREGDQVVYAYVGDPRDAPSAIAAKVRESNITKRSDGTWGIAPIAFSGRVVAITVDERIVIALDPKQRNPADLDASSCLSLLLGSTVRIEQAPREQ